MRESAIEIRVNQWARDNGVSTLKLNGPGNRGKADRVYMREGKAVFTELKAPGKKATALQEKFLAERRDDGFSAEWFDNAALAVKWLKQELLGT